MNLENLLYEKVGGIATITINRPDVLNALNARTMAEFDMVFEDAEKDGDVRVLIVTGAGEKAFAAGADISELIKCNPETGKELSTKGQRILRWLETMGKPSLAAVNGFALGGGCEVAMACTIRIASDKAKFGQPEVNLGIIPGYAGTQRLPRIVGEGVAMELLLTGRVIDADEALRVGLVSAVVPGGELMEAAKKTASAILGKGPLAVRDVMGAVDKGMSMGFEDACKLEASLFGALCASSDMKEGMGAFLERRKAEFKGE
jgi:enoyl-CoA hydratase